VLCVVVRCEVVRDVSPYLDYTVVVDRPHGRVRRGADHALRLPAHPRVIRNPEAVLNAEQPANAVDRVKVAARGSARAGFTELHGFVGLQFRKR
jgi:hypothetical protein